MNRLPIPGKKACRPEYSYGRDHLIHRRGVGVQRHQRRLRSFILSLSLGSALFVADCRASKSFGPLPDNSAYNLEAAFTNDSGQHLSLSEFRGQKVAIALIYTNCTYICPRIVSDMKRLQDHLPRKGTHFIAVSFDTERDSPAALRAYRKRMKLDDDWSLLTGSPSTVRELAAVLGLVYTRLENGDFSHSIAITLLDENGVILHKQEGNMGDTEELLQYIH